MDQESIVYGCIKDTASYRSDAERRRNNRNVMLTLPSSDEWPYLYREMFSIPQIEVGSGNYHTEVIHFGASYKAIEYEWRQWMNQFEHLLSQLYWVSAVVHLETELSGTHTFTWESSSIGHEPGTGVCRVHCEWSHENTFA
jgi:hypothetical protein